MLLSDEFVRIHLSNLPMDVESIWNDLPGDSKETVLRLASKRQLAQLDAAMMFILLPHNFANDKSYHWNLWQTKRSAYILAADLWLNGKNKKALIMVFYAAFADECLARGYDIVAAYFVGKVGIVKGSNILQELDPDWTHGHRTVDYTEGSVTSSFNLLHMHSYFAFLHHALVNTKSGRNMHEFLITRLKELPGTNKWIGRMSRMRSMPATVHDCNPHPEAVPHELIKLKHLGDNFSTVSEMAVYQDTLFNLVFNISLVYVCNTDYSIFKWGRFHAKTSMSCLSLQFCTFPSPTTIRAPPKKRFYAVTNRTKTIGELDIQDGDSFYNRLNDSAVAAALNDITQKLRDKEVAALNRTDIKATPKAKEEDGTVLRLGSQRKGKGKNKKKSPKQQTNYLKSELNNEYILKEAHSNAMEPVLNELRPKLKSIRDKLSALSLRRELPKTRVAKKIKPEANDAHLMPISANNDLGGKAGKSLYPILVGDVNNLYNTSILKSLPPQKVVTLDLHSCSWYKAKGVLRKNLEKWIDLAMKGEHPFVIRVDIVCGGGNQVLSELVASFIRDSPQVANRPKRRS